MNRLKIGLLYVSLHNQLKIKAGASRCVSRKIFFEKLGRHFLIPKKLKPIVIREMIAMKLVEKGSDGSLIILECDIDMDKDANKLYELCGIF